MAFCIKCGTNVGDSLFCGNCGAKITYNEKKHNILDNANESEQSTNAYRVKVHSKKKAEPESISNEQNFFTSDPLPSVQPEPQYNEGSESNIYSGQKEPSFYSHEPTDIFSNTNRSKVKPHRITEESSNSDYKANDKKQSVNLRVKGKAAPKTHAKKAVITIICIISAVAVIASAVAIGIYIKPKADLYEIANAAIKTAFKSGSYNFNIDSINFQNEYTDENNTIEIGDNYNGCVIWGNDVKNSYFYAYSGDANGLSEVVKYENGYWRYSEDGYNFTKEDENLLLEVFGQSSFSNEDFGNLTLDESGAREFVTYAVIPLANDAFMQNYESSLRKLSYSQLIDALKNMLLDKDFNKSAVSIDSKNKNKGNTEYCLTIDIDAFIKACWNYLKNTDIYELILGNSDNRKEFDKEMTDYFNNIDGLTDLTVNLKITINRDGYITDFLCQYAEDEEADNTYYSGYKVEIYNFGQAVKQK